jgi:hypothetical protein
LDLPFWSSQPPAPYFDLVPRLVIEDPTVHVVHARRIAEADMSFPLDVMEHRGRLCVMDGLHRLARAVRDGEDTISIRRIPRSAIQRSPSNRFTTSGSSATRDPGTLAAEEDFLGAIRSQRAVEHLLQLGPVCGIDDRGMGRVHRTKAQRQVPPEGAPQGREELLSAPLNALLAALLNALLAGHRPRRPR